MSFQNQVVIGPEFFAKAKNDYNRWQWAIIREFCQNSIDCGSKTIRISITKDAGNVVMVVENDGDPMTEDIIRNKLLSLGASGKNFQGSVGGFGKAKEILYFIHRSYEIKTGEFVVTGSGAGYNIDAGEYYSGTSSRIVIESLDPQDLVDELKSNLRTFAGYTQWSGELYLNDERLSTDLYKGSFRRDLGFAKVYTNKSCQDRVIVRINGTPMFYDYIDFNRCVIVELTGTSADVLTSNRDGLSREYRNQLNAFLTDLAVNKSSALRKRGLVKYQLYGGKRITHTVVRPTDFNPKLDIICALEQVAKESFKGPTTRSQLLSAGSANDVRETIHRTFNSTISEEFIVKNETDLTVPSYYLPNSPNFSDYSRKLAKIWGRLLLELHRLFEHEADFAIGFIFDDDQDNQIEAQFEVGPYGTVYYLNPAKVVKQSSSISKSFKKRFQLVERNRLLMIALHEFLHGFGYASHNEAYANQLTDFAWKVFNVRKRFNWCFA